MKTSCRILVPSLTLACFLNGQGRVHGQDNSMISLSYTGKVMTLDKECFLPVKTYTGERGRLNIQSTAEQNHVFKISEGTVLEDVNLILTGPSRLIIESSLLRRCLIITSNLSSVTIHNSVLDRCVMDLAGNRSAKYRSIEVTGSVLSGCGLLKPVNWLQLRAESCTFLHMKSPEMILRLLNYNGGTIPEYLTKDPYLRKCRFVSCKISPLLLTTVTDCAFDDCEYSPLPASNRSPLTPKSDAVRLRVKWDNSRPPELFSPVPEVAFDILENAESQGAALEHFWDGTGVLSPSIPVAETQESFFAEIEAMFPELTSSMTSDSSLKLKQTQVNGLLVMPLASGKEAGSLTRMTLTAIPGFGATKFAQAVGSDMSTSLQAVTRFIELRHERLAKQNDFEIAFQQKYSGKDGPSAAVACALLLESAITGQTWDSAFAVTGDMNQDGSVQPIGGVSAKIRGAANGECKIVAIPMKNETALVDVLLLDGPNALCKTAVFGISNFEEATALAATERLPILQQALDEFMVIREVLVRDPRTQMQILRTPQAITRLQAILSKAPHCLSAKHLLLYAQGRLPTSLSLAGSIQETDSSGEALLAAIDNDINSESSLRLDDVGSAINRLRNLRPRFDKRVWPYLDAIVSYGEIIRGAIVNPIRSGARANDVRNKAMQAAKNIQSTKQTLLADPQVVEELGL